MEPTQLVSDTCPFSLDLSWSSKQLLEWRGKTSLLQVTILSSLEHGPVNSD